MAITNKQKYDLNNMNVAAQNVSLGNIIDNLNTLSSQSASAIDITGGYINGVKFGTSTNYSLFESDGTFTMSGSATVWDDIFFPLVTAKQGQTDKPAFSTVDLGYLFPQNDTSQFMMIVAQFPHSMKEGSNINPHVHWNQNHSGSVVFKMDYKWFPIGGSIPAAFETHVMPLRVLPYTSGSMHQLNYGTAISGSILGSGIGAGVSSIMLIKLYRDDDTYTGNAITYQFDIHYEKDTLGSRTEFAK